MKSPYISQLQPNQVVTVLFLVQTRDIRQKKTGEPYLSLVLADRTGEIEGKMWDNVTEVMDTFDRDDFVRAKGVMQIYQGRQQFTIHKVMRVQDCDVDFADYFPCSARDPEEMFAELSGVIAGIGNTHLRTLLEYFVNDARIARAYKIAPAAKNVHHAFLGGLLEHVLSLCELAKMTCRHYPYVDLDLMLAGAVLHDVGKISELTYERSFGYSTEGQLLGHIVIGLRMIADKIALIPDFPPSLRTLLEHLIVSHHGELEFGSPKVPQFPEAMLLHQLDNLDSKMECMRAMIAKERQVDGCWTGWNGSLGRAVLRKAAWLEAQRPPEPGIAKAAAATEDAPPPPPPPPVARVDVPLPAPAVRADSRPPVPVTGSLFGDKLQEALHKES